MPLEEYRAKRDFESTPEPSGGRPSPGALRFVVQQHHASRMHWDFRLELDGVLMSWAVPKGPSLDPAEKRLAVHVEDHPLDYADFEGVIPPGQYGAGSVIVWDRGTWEPLADAHAGLAKGDFKFRLFGEKLIGGWVLVRLKPRGNEKAENWLLIKERDEHVRPASDYSVTAERPESVLTGRTVDAVAGSVPPAEAAPGPAEDPAVTVTAAPAPMPELALCTLVTAAPTGGEWLSEVKYDGYRVTLLLDGGSVRALSRAGADATKRFPAIIEAARSLPADSAVIDGEAVVFDERGATDFGELQRVLKAEPGRVAYVAFDLVELNGHDLRGLPTVTRKELLRELLRDAPAALRTAEHVEGDAPAFFEVACAQGLEGAVFKRADAPYPAGRTGAWLKAKCRRAQEFVVGGWTEPRGSRPGFGALLLGVFGEDGGLRYAGRVGSGFTDDQLRDIARRLARIGRSTSPFTAVPPDLAVRGPHWVTPSLVAQVAYAEWTAEGLLRQPSFLGLRDDVPAANVIREVAAAETTAPDTPAPTPEGTVVSGITITNPGKRLFPGTAWTKLDLARYYEEIAPAMLREVAERPLTLVRCPVGDGAGTCFYQRHPERGTNRRIRTVSHALSGHDAADEWLLANDRETLVTLAQMGVAEVHTWLSRSDALSRPDRLVFDLDPGPDVVWERIAEAARHLRESLVALGLTPHLKSTGSKGLHIVSPVEPVWEFDRVHALARAIATAASADRPDLMTTKMAKSARTALILVDYVRNSEGASVVAPYSTRHREGPGVAVPLAWDELDDPAFDARAFTPDRVLERMRAGTDPWRDIDAHAAGARVLRTAESRMSG